VIEIVNFCVSVLFIYSPMQALFVCRVLVNDECSVFLVLVLKTFASDALKMQFIKYRFRFKWFGQTDLDNSRHDQNIFNTKWSHHDFLVHMAL
jgi:hypothetical protein